MSPIQVIRPLKYRAIWISDVQLGSKYSRAEFLLDFLKSSECESLYLVGDIVDLWAMRKAVYWPHSHNNVIRSIPGKAKRGTKIIYIPGNHDALVRDSAGARFGEVEIRDNATHTTADGKKLLVLRGDEFDNVIRCNGQRFRDDAARGALSQAALDYVQAWSIGRMVERKVAVYEGLLASALKREAAAGRSLG